MASVEWSSSNGSFTGTLKEGVLRGEYADLAGQVWEIRMRDVEEILRVKFELVVRHTSGSVEVLVSQDDICGRHPEDRTPTLPLPALRNEFRFAELLVEVAREVESWSLFSVDWDNALVEWRQGRYMISLGRDHEYEGAFVLSLHEHPGTTVFHRGTFVHRPAALMRAIMERYRQLRSEDSRESCG